MNQGALLAFVRYIFTLLSGKGEHSNEARTSKLPFCPASRSATSDILLQFFNPYPRGVLMFFLLHRGYYQPPLYWLECGQLNLVDATRACKPICTVWRKVCLCDHNRPRGSLDYSCASSNWLRYSH